MLTAQTLDNPAGIPPEAPRLQPSDYVHAAGTLTLEKIIAQAGRKAHTSITMPVKRANITFTIQPYVDQNQEPKLWLEAYTGDPDSDPRAQLIGMARISYQTGEDDRRAKARNINGHIRNLSILHED